jgi:hypothetical protein
MYITCPRCQRKYNIKQDNIPKQGIWGICPNCSEKFFIPSVSLETIIYNEKPAYFRQKSNFNQKEHNFNIDASSEITGQITSLRTSLHKNLFYIILIIITCFILYGIANTYNMASNANDIFVEEVPSEIDVTTYNISNVRQDIRYIMRKISSKGYVFSIIDYKSSESELFKFLQSKIATESCKDIISVTLSSDRPLYGFELESQCLNKSQRGIKLYFAFLEGWSIIKNINTNTIYRVPVYDSAILGNLRQ